jgi:hypothetical protein
VFDCSLPLAAMFAGLPPSSSELTKRKTLFRHLLLQIGGANIENTARDPLFDCSLRLAAMFAGLPPS